MKEQKQNKRGMLKRNIFSKRFWYATTKKILEAYLFWPEGPNFFNISNWIIAVTLIFGESYFYPRKFLSLLSQQVLEIKLTMTSL